MLWYTVFVLYFGDDYSQVQEMSNKQWHVFNSGNLGKQLSRSILGGDLAGF